MEISRESSTVPDNLIFISEHTDSSLFECISTRLQSGNPFTMAGSILISTSSGSSPSLYSEDQREAYRDSSQPPHLYSISSKALNRLQSTYANQVITLLGSSGSGKTFSAVHLLDHLCYLSKATDQFPALHASLQVLHVMGSTSRLENQESSSCGIVSSLLYDNDFKMIGGSFKAKLLDYSLPFSTTGNSYHVLHSLVTASKTQLQSLGLSSMPSFKLFLNRPFNSKEIIYFGQNFDRFFKNLQILKFSRNEIQEVLEMLSVVLLLFEISFVGSHFVVAGDKEKVEWTVRHRTAVKKVCKILLVSEEKFLQVFQGISHKSSVENKIKELARSVYVVTFEWVLWKINQRVKKLCSDDLKSQPSYQISVVDFPGFQEEGCLSGLSSNIALECLNLFASEKLLGLLHDLETEKISMKIFESPSSLELVSLFLSKDFGFLQSLEDPNFDRYWKEFRGLSKSLKSLKTSNISLSVQFAWGEVEYETSSLRVESLKYLHPGDFSPFFLKCSNSILRKMHPPDVLSHSSTLRKDLSSLLEPLVGSENSLIYFIRGKNGKLDYSETIRLFRNTLVMPSLFWEWYGYEHWVSNSKLLNDLGVKQDSAGQTSTFISSLLSEVLPENDFLVGLTRTLLKDRAFHIIDEKCSDPNFKFPVDSRTKATFKAFSPKNMKKVIKARSNQVLIDYGSAFYYNCYGEQHLAYQEIYNFLDNLADVNEMSFKKETFSRKSSKLTSLSSVSSLKDTLQTVRSEKHFKNLKHSLSNFHLINYSSQLSSIIFIQKHWKGFQARKYFKAFQLLNRKASKIQSTWKAYQARKAFISLKTTVKVLQKFFKLRFKMKTSAASKIQTWFKHFCRPLPSAHIEDISSQLSSIESENLSGQVLHSILKPTQAKNPEETFKPKINDYSRNLAKLRELKLGNMNLPVEKRLENMHLLKNTKIEDLRKTKVDQERQHLKATPSINKSSDLLMQNSETSNFLQRQERKTLQIRMKREKEFVKKQSEELSSYTFKPTLVSKSCKRIERSVKDLHIWAEVKKFQLTRAQKVKADEEVRSLSPCAMSNNSKRILIERQARLAEQLKLANEVKESLLPYWPNKPEASG